jgi:hypothetical protein
MADIFDLSQRGWRFDARIPAPLAATQLPLPKQAAWQNAEPASYRTARTSGFDWSQEDLIPAAAFNDI